MCFPCREGKTAVRKLFATLTAPTLGVAFLALALAACQREERNFQGLPPAASTGIPAVRETDLQAGPATRKPPAQSPYEENAYGVSQGKTLYLQYNCSGCHFLGGGGIGPPLMDADWIYGSRPENIFETISEGRPNGMPSFGGKIVPDQIWQIVAYVQSMSGQAPKDAAPGRSDHMAGISPESSRAKAKPVMTGQPQ